MARTLDTTIVVRVSEKEKKELIEEARRLGVSLGKLVRTKATASFAEQVNAHTSIAQEKFIGELAKQMADVVETSRLNNHELYLKLHALFRAEEY